MFNKSAKFCVHSSSKMMTFFSQILKVSSCIVGDRYLECFFNSESNYVDEIALLKYDAQIFMQPLLTFFVNLMYLP